MRFHLWMTLVLLFLFCACTSKPARKRIPMSIKQVDTLAIQQAKKLSGELKQIEELLGKQSQTVFRTEEDIPYIIQESGEGEPLSAHDQAEFRGTISDLDGNVLYDYRHRALVFRIMDYTWPSLMQKSLVGMQPGEQRVVYVPSSYAYGLSGDGQKIGPYCSLIINFRLEALR
jgi:FKBP-type peptidyl-prolyl cis-trans isomerase